MRATWALLIALASAALPAAACERSEKIPPAQQIAACTALIDAGGLDPARLAAALRNRANAYFETRDYLNAFRDFDAAIRHAPAEPRNFLARGSALWARREHDRAIRDYDEAVRLLAEASSPESRRLLATAHFERGVAYEDKKDDDRAMQDFGRAIALDPSHPGPFEHRASIHLRRESYASAIRDYDAAIRANPLTDRLLSMHIFYEAMRRHRSGKYAAAIILHDGVLRRQPRFAMGLYARGLAYRRLGDSARAEADIAAAKAIDPKIADDAIWRGE